MRSRRFLTNGLQLARTFGKYDSQLFVIMNISEESSSLSISGAGTNNGRWAMSGGAARLELTKINAFEAGIVKIIETFRRLEPLLTEQPRMIHTQ